MVPIIISFLFIDAIDELCLWHLVRSTLYRIRHNSLITHRLYSELHAYIDFSLVALYRLEYFAKRMPNVVLDQYHDRQIISSLGAGAFPRRSFLIPIDYFSNVWIQNSSATA